MSCCDSASSAHAVVAKGPHKTATRIADVGAIAHTRAVANAVGRGLSFGTSLHGAAKTLLDDLQLHHLKPIPCDAEVKGINSHATYVRRFPRAMLTVADTS